MYYGRYNGTYCKSNYIAWSCYNNLEIEVGHTLCRLNKSLLGMEDFKINITSTMKKDLEINDTEEAELVTVWEEAKAILKWYDCLCIRR